MSHWTMDYFDVTEKVDLNVELFLNLLLLSVVSQSSDLIGIFVSTEAHISASILFSGYNG